MEVLPLLGGLQAGSCYSALHLPSSWSCLAIRFQASRTPHPPSPAPHFSSATR